MISIIMHNITSAEAMETGNGSSWVTVKTDNGSEATLFLTVDKCKAIADIINGVDERLTMDEMFSDIEK